MDKESFEDCIRSLLIHIEGETANREGLEGTPDRIRRMYEELYKGYSMDYEEILSKQFDVGEDPSLVTVEGITFYSTCEHHMMPFFGTVAIQYMPKKGGKVVGLSKLARLVECFARRLQIQERMGAQIGNAIMACLNPEYVIVTIEAEHTCVTARGVNKPGSKTVTVYKKDTQVSSYRGPEDF